MLTGALTFSETMFMAPEEVPMAPEEVPSATRAVELVLPVWTLMRGEVDLPLSPDDNVISFSKTAALFCETALLILG
jgi:hypothetical protein